MAKRKYCSVLRASAVGKVRPPHSGAGLPQVAVVLISVVMPTAEAAAVATLAACVEGTGAVAEDPTGKVHWASVNPHRPVPVVVVVRARLAAAWRPVSSVPTKRWLEVLL